jgi:enoyl-[acyl-carrier-protein] reductase (NADH)
MTVRSQENPVIREWARERQPLAEGRIDAEAVARAALFLLSDDAAAITGIDLPTDAGGASAMTE